MKGPALSCRVLSCAQLENTLKCAHVLCGKVLKVYAWMEESLWVL